MDRGVASRPLVRPARRRRRRGPGRAPAQPQVRHAQGQHAVPGLRRQLPRPLRPGSHEPCPRRAPNQGKNHVCLRGPHADLHRRRRGLAMGRRCCAFGRAAGRRVHHGRLCAAHHGGPDVWAVDLGPLGRLLRLGRSPALAMACRHLAEALSRSVHGGTARHWRQRTGFLVARRRCGRRCGAGDLGVCRPAVHAFCGQRGLGCLTHRHLDRHGAAHLE
mmetsp:Transcript_21450/g.67778  ORF Transcript_21450/g.67778 Transcript_21450/m.67778 type:complete len:218 (+) Transcript_21450:1848-2501(+)